MHLGSPAPTRLEGGNGNGEITHARLREILRQKLVLGLTHRQVASAVGVSAGKVTASTATRGRSASMRQLLRR